MLRVICNRLAVIAYLVGYKVSETLLDLGTVTIASGVINAKITSTSREVKLAVSEILSYEVENAKNTMSFKRGDWDGRSSFFDYATGTFPAGFTYMVKRQLSRLGYRVNLVCKEAPEPLGPEIGTHDPLGYGFSDRYDYQPEAVRRLLRHKRMIARVATGGGKSNIGVLAFSTIRRMTLFLTTRGSLMWQMKENFEKAGFIPGVIGDAILKPRKGVNVAMVQTIASWLAKPNLDDPPEKAEAQNERRKRMLELLARVEFVIGEEAHEAGGSSYYEILRACPNAHYRLALTATPFMRDDDESNMRLQAAFGSIGIEVSEKLLIDREILARPYFKFLPTPKTELLRKGTTWPNCYDLGVVMNDGRNLQALEQVVRAQHYNRSAMVLIRRKSHGETLQRMFDQAGLKSKFIFGENDQAERKRALDGLAARELDVLIGSTILDVGVDMPAVGMVVLAGGGKAEVGHRQRIGRGLRAKKPPEANNCFIVDWEDENNRILRDHASTRKAIVVNTPGFDVGLLAPDQPFPWEEH